MVKQLKQIAAGWYLVEQAEQDTLLFTDIRFGQFGFEEDSPFFWKYKLWMNDKGVMEAYQIQMKESVDFGKAFSELGDRIKGN